MFLGLITVCVLMMVGAVQGVAVELPVSACGFDPGQLPDACFNSSLTSDCSKISTSGSIYVVNVKEVIVISLDGTGGLLGTDAVDVSVNTASTVTYAVSSSATKLEIELVWADNAKAIGYGKLDQCIDDTDLCSPVFNVLPCDTTTRTEVNFDNFGSFTWGKLDYVNGLAGAGAGSLHTEFTSPGWCLYHELFYMMQFSFSAGCGTTTEVLTLTYQNEDLDIQTFLEFEGTWGKHKYYIMQKEPMNGFCIFCPSGVTVQGFSAYIVSANL